jgi:hypothetical protein
MVAKNTLRKQRVFQGVDEVKKRKGLTEFFASQGEK